MVLRVGFEMFASTVKKLLGVEEAYVCDRGNGCVATAAKPGQDLVVATVVNLPAKATQAKLAEEGLAVAEGEWSQDGEGLEVREVSCAVHIGAVAYESKGAKPGLWVDAFPEPQTPTQVLKAMYDELRENGELGDVSFEEFIRLANPNVVILSPPDLTRFVSQHTPCP